MPRFRILAITPIVFFAPTLVTFALFGSHINDVLGILFHLAMWFVVARMPAPEWARTAGYGWLTLDLATGAMLLNSVPFDTAFPVRLGGHILAGVWVITASRWQGHRSIRILGVVIGLWLSLYTFFSPVLPIVLLAPPGVLTCVWLGLLAWKLPDLPAPRTPHDAPAVSDH